MSFNAPSTSTSQTTQTHTTNIDNHKTNINACSVTVLVIGLLSSGTLGTLLGFYCGLEPALIGGICAGVTVLGVFLSYSKCTSTSSKTKPLFLYTSDESPNSSSQSSQNDSPSSINTTTVSSPVEHNNSGINVIPNTSEGLQASSSQTSQSSSSNTSNINATAITPSIPKSNPDVNIVLTPMKPLASSAKKLSTPATSARNMYQTPVKTARPAAPSLFSPLRIEGSRYVAPDGKEVRVTFKFAEDNTVWGFLGDPKTSIWTVMQQWISENLEHELSPADFFINGIQLTNEKSSPSIGSFCGKQVSIVLDSSL